VRREEQEKLKKKRERFRTQLLGDYAETFKSAHGRRVLVDLLKQCFFLSSTFTGNSSTFKNEGKREVALYIISAVMKTDPDVITKVLHDSEELKKIWTEQS